MNTSRWLALGSVAVASVAVALLAAPPASGQGGGSALKGHDTNQPVDVAADRIEVQDRADRAIFSGNVDVRQGNLRLAAPRLTVTYADASGIDIQRLEASGGVTLTSPSENARSNVAIYDLNRRVVTMIGNVTLRRAGNNVNGGRLVLDLDSGRAVMDGGTAGSPSRASSGRVTGRFTVPQRANPTTPPAPEPKGS
ncbi:lipopolysaccharide transport periplasmic protein LptA [Sphingosinicella sp. LHD-64]|uniref:lipopolysaccharide transport periplasmic protein LptA n=1 Tax=Sphingosinicella sp. LHD-64 TaxID=3072139 RepID=UPI0028109AEF|nr:lipopolysaccharide transport periplasmic protein LptA [Sphingosinicella sp. LHD-64]MDQ8756851.1 lipopolysaccharide transport periplasmic protein LptA [Sphingosinicella sp. LHD-64]